jgi:dTDP-4-amino-4,6-dideoxygalactose transaminase
MRVPLLDLKEQLKPLRDEILAGVTELIDSTGYILGPQVDSLERGVAEYCQTAHGIGVSSGTDALLVALMALGIGPGDYVLTTPYTFIATLGCILRLGAKPVFVDIDPVSFNIDSGQVGDILADAAYAGKIKAILPVHLYGQCADMATISALAAEYGIPVVEDAAQAIGAQCPVIDNGKTVWKRAGSMGDAGCFSFFPSKNLGGIGDAGMITVNDDNLAELIKIVRVHGGAPKYHHAILGGNFRIDPIQAVALNVKLPHLPDWHKARRRNAALYKRFMAENDLIGEMITVPATIYKDAATADGVEDYHIYNQFVVRCKQRDELKEYLWQADIGCEIYYPIPLHKQGCVRKFGFNDLSFPHSEKAAAETLALPIYPELTEEMIHFVVEKIAEFYANC